MVTQVHSHRRILQARTQEDRRTLKGTGAQNDVIGRQLLPAQEFNSYAPVTIPQQMSHTLACANTHPTLRTSRV